MTIFRLNSGKINLHLKQKYLKKIIFVIDMSLKFNVLLAICFDHDSVPEVYWKRFSRRTSSRKLSKPLWKKQLRCVSRKGIFIK